MAGVATAPTSIGIRRATLATAVSLDKSGWLILLAVTVGTNLIDFAAVPAAGTPPGAAFLLAVLLRIALVFWLVYALLRRLTDTPGPLSVTIAFWRLALLQMILLIGVGLATRLGAIMTGPHPTLAAEWLGGLLAIALVGLLTIRLAAWHTALAVGEPFAALGPLWRGQRAITTPLALAFMVLVLPIAALHLALTLVGLRTPLSAPAHILLGIFDGLVQAWQLLLSLALGVVGWRFARNSASQAG